MKISTSTTQPRLFEAGQLIFTPGAYTLFMKGVNLIECLKRHLSGDWGDVCEEDRLANQSALEQGRWLFSCYKTPHGDLWIITEADRSSTCILRPEEY